VQKLIGVGLDLLDLFANAAVVCFFLSYISVVCFTAYSDILSKFSVDFVAAMTDAGRYNCSFTLPTNRGRKTFMESIDIAGNAGCLMISVQLLN